LFFFFNTIPLTVRAPAARATGTTVSTTPVFVLPEEAPGVTSSDLPMSPAAKAAVEQAATIAIEATVAKIFFISLSSMYSVLVKHVLVFSYMQSRGFLEKFQVFLKNSKVFLNISLSTAYISVVGGGGEKVSEILKNF
jgi:hypothetical protein